MKHVLGAVLAAAATLAFTPAAMAQPQGRQGVECRQDDRDCQRRQQPGQSGQQAQQQQPGSRPPVARGQAQAEQAAPRPGTSGRAGQPFSRAANSRFSPPPRGQEYRVVDGHLVLIDSATLRIVSVLGLLSALIR